MIFQQRRSDHITDELASLHWLRVPERIQFKIAVLAYKVLHGSVSAPRYLGPLVRVPDLPRGRRSSPLCQNWSPGRAAIQTIHYWQQNM